MITPKIKILFVGRYEAAEILSGPGKVAKRIFAELKAECTAEFWEYFFEGSIFGYNKKFFGSDDIRPEPDIQISRKGIFPAVISLFKMKPRLVHIITFERFAFIFLLLKSFLGYKICYNVHGIVAYEKEINAKSGFNLLNLKDSLLEKMLFKKADRLLFLSEQAVKIASEYFSVDMSKVTLIKNGIDNVFYELKCTGAQNGLGLRLIAVGDYDRREKGIGFLISALKNITVPVILTVVGKSIPGIENETTGNLRIIFCKKLNTEDYAALLCRNDVFVSASSYDTYNIASAEAMAAGLIPVLTRETGSAFLINDHITGFLYNFGDAGTLVNIIEKIYYHPALRQQIRKNTADAYTSFKWKIIASDYLNIYKGMLAE